MRVYKTMGNLFATQIPTTTPVSVVVPGSADNVFLGGGVWGENDRAVPMTKVEGAECSGECTVWSANVERKHAGGHFTILKNLDTENLKRQWHKKEHIAGQDCADAENFNDRVFPEDMSQPLNLTYGMCGDATNKKWDLPCETTVSVTVVAAGSDATSMHLGGGVWGANDRAVPMTKVEGAECSGECTVWSANVERKHAGGHFTILKNVDLNDSAHQWGKKEDIAGQNCAKNNYNDRQFPDDMSQPLNLIFGACKDPIWQFPGTTLVDEGAAVESTRAAAVIAKDAPEVKAAATADAPTETATKTVKKDAVTADAPTAETKTVKKDAVTADALTAETKTVKKDVSVKAAATADAPTAEAYNCYNRRCSRIRRQCILGRWCLGRKRSSCGNDQSGRS